MIQKEIKLKKEGQLKTRENMKKYETEISERLNELNEAIQQNDNSKIQQLYQNYLTSPFLQHIESLPTNSKANLTQSWSELGTKYKENISENNETSSTNKLDINQIQEITKVFYTFDKERNGNINELDYQQCLTSLGYVLGEDVSGKIDEVDLESKS